MEEVAVGAVVPRRARTVATVTRTGRRAVTAKRVLTARRVPAPAGHTCPNCRAAAAACNVGKGKEARHSGAEEKGEADSKMRAALSRFSPAELRELVELKVVEPKAKAHVSKAKRPCS